ncbi:hypothetical protein BDP27DRAFT_1429840 [Rhodocollybia butyracea]|uniref:DUF6532 domain-containing protein n=1 Tax=Rhodocollybia butyracea TaxID=206335 RepID=A0A9P5TZQ9_9AGAR|nr:hypothetical protein BDP27DRAFT_1429840 [Rhodocollybia butyracea]
MSGRNKRRNSASVHSQKKPKTSSSQPSKKANGPEKPRQVGHVQAYARTFDASAEGAIPKELRKDGLELNDQEQAYLQRFRVGTSGNDSTSDIPHTLDDETQQDSDVTMEYGEGDEGGDGDNGDEGDEGDNGDEGDDMVIEDVMKENKNKNKQNGTRAKVLQSDLASDALAKISKQAVRKAICLLDMFPSDKMFAWEVLEEELVSQQGDDNRILEDLRETKKDPQALDKLLRWMGYSESDVRYALAQQTRTLVDPYFGFSSVDEGGPQAELANWLMGEGRYHCEGVDFKERKSGKPFYSLLIAQILRAFLVDAQNKTTYRLITTELPRLQCVPGRLIAAVTATVFVSTSCRPAQTLICRSITV